MNLPPVQGRDVFHHGLAAVAEARCLDRDDVQDAAHLVDDEGREGVTVEIFGDDQERATRLRELLQNRETDRRRR